MRVLSIGNSFSHDAHAWLAPLAAADGVEITCVNLMIGGCSLAEIIRNRLRRVSGGGFFIRKTLSPIV